MPSRTRTRTTVTAAAYSITDLAKIMNVSYSFIDKEIRKGEIKAFKLGRNWRITLIEFADYYRRKTGDKYEP